MVVIGDLETPALGGVAVATMGDMIRDARTTNVDTVSGATVTSNVTTTNSDNTN